MIWPRAYASASSLARSFTAIVDVLIRPYFTGTAPARLDAAFALAFAVVAVARSPIAITVAIV